MKRNSVWCEFIAGLLWCVGTQPGCAASAKAVVRSEADLPRFSYPIGSSASALVDADDLAYTAFAGKVRVDLDRVLNNYDIQDKSTLRGLLAEKLNLQELGGEYRQALQTAATLNTLEEKPAAKLTGELFTMARLHAAIDTGGSGTTAYPQAFIRHYRETVAPLPWQIVRDAVRVAYAAARLTTRARVLGIVQTDIDPAVSKSGAVNNDEAADIIEARVALKLEIPLAVVSGQVLQTYITAHNAPKPDIWATRDVTLHVSQHLTPVLVGIWDSGIDLNDFPNQVFTDPMPTASGVHGVAFDDRGLPSKDWLHPLTASEQAAYPQARETITGTADLQEGIDSPAAEATVKLYATLSVAQMHQLIANRKMLGFYMHGTHCAGIAVRGNPAARLVVARFNDQLADLPFAPTQEWVRRVGADFQQMADYFRTRNVRVVNMSWGDEPHEFELWLSKTGGGADPAERKRRASELFVLWRNSIETAIRSAPGTLFIAAAGNSNNNPAFTDDAPASFHLPNLIVVGAVNQAGDETSFTSHGETVVVHADGYHVSSLVPGGTKLLLSGTSMASPNVVNLAAKLFALDPSLTPADVADLIKRGATTTDDGRRHLIDEKRSVALLAERHAH